MLQVAEQEAELRSLRCQTATLADDAETAQLRAARAESRMNELHEQTEHLLESAAQAATNEQVLCNNRVNARLLAYCLMYHRHVFVARCMGDNPHLYTQDLRQGVEKVCKTSCTASLSSYQPTRPRQWQACIA